MTQALGIDIGGSGIKGAIVDITNGEFVSERFRATTPSPSTAPAVAEVVGMVARHFNWQGAIGCTFPGVVKQGIIYSAANVDTAWIGINARELFTSTTGCAMTVLNDADAAGIGELHFGAAHGQNGVVLLLTFGTGIGSALFVDGQLVPNTELGHVEVGGKESEQRASDRARTRGSLSWKQWSKRVNRVLKNYEMLFSPDLFVIGGGVSQSYEKFLPMLTIKTPIVPASLRNSAGIVGAAFAATHANAVPA